MLCGACACVAVPEPRPADPAAPEFPVLSFFEGRTEGRGTLRVIFRSPRAIHVRGSGRVAPDGTLVLHQRIREEGKAPRERVWRIRKTSPSRYAGTLSDAEGPVAGEARGNRLRLAYTAEDGMRVEQVLTLAPDGRSAHNALAVRKWGLPVAALEETIRKLD